MSRFLNVTDVVAEPGNVLIRTKLNAYEVDQEQKLIRCIAGESTGLSVSGDWREYSTIGLPDPLGTMGVVFPNGHCLFIHGVRLEGTLVPPAP